MLNGALMPEQEAFLQINDLSIRRGYGIFDFFRVHDGQPLYMDRHLQRFYNGAKATYMDPGFPVNVLADQVKALIRANNGMPGHAAVRMVLTGGYNAWEPVSPNLMITCEMLKGYDESFYTGGARVISHSFMRELPTVKTISYMTAVVLTPRMKKESALEVLYHMNGLVHEFSRSNIFIVRNGNLYTPSENVLPGVTRNITLELARTQMPVQEKSLTLQEVLEADEVFMTSTIKRIIPVIQIDQNRIAEGKPGGVTRTLMQLLATRDQQEAALDLTEEG